MTPAQRDRSLAVAAAAFATVYIVAARGIEDSLLADAVGAGGVPQGVGIAMLLASLALFAKSFSGRSAPPVSAPQAGWRRTALRVVGLVGVLLGYGALLPWLGYPLTLSLLVLAAGRLAGAPLKAPLWLCAAASGPLLWLVFDRVLQVHMPAGTLWG